MKVPVAFVKTPTSFACWSRDVDDELQRDVICTIGMAGVGPVGNDWDRRVTLAPTAAANNETDITIGFC